MMLLMEDLDHIHKREKRIYHSRVFTALAKRFDLEQKRVFDIGCGYGEYMQRFGSGSVGITTRSFEVEYGKTCGRDIRLGNAELLKDTLRSGEKFDAIWCNNIFEHLLAPHAFLVHLKEYVHKDSLLILGTPMIPFPAFLTRFSKWRGALALEHINFFTKATYEETVTRTGWDVIENRPFYIPVPILDSCLGVSAPHLYLVAKNNSDFKYHERKKSEWVEDPHYADLLRIQG